MKNLDLRRRSCYQHKRSISFGFEKSTGGEIQTSNSCCYKYDHKLKRGWKICFISFQDLAAKRVGLRQHANNFFNAFQRVALKKKLFGILISHLKKKIKLKYYNYLFLVVIPATVFIISLSERGGSVSTVKFCE